MAVIGIDHGWSMGWAVRTRLGVQSGVFDSRKGNPTDGARLLAQSDFLTALLKKLADAGEIIEEIAYEQITFVGKNDADTLHAHGKQLGNLQRWACLKKQPVPRGIAWDVIKKHVTGHRSAAREMMLATVGKAMPEVTDHNQASAVAVMLTATNQKLPTTEASPRAAQRSRSAGP